MRHLVVVFTLLASSVHGLTISDQSNAQPKQLVIVRSHSPHSHMLAAMLSYFADIKVNMTNSRFLVSVDTTNWMGSGPHPEQPKNIINKIKQFLPEAEIHTYDKSSVTDAYKRIPADGFWTSRWGTVLHTEPLNLARRYAVDRFGMEFDYIWEAEDDVLICGGITKVMTRYAGNSADLLGVMPGLGRVEEWENRDFGTQQFLQRYPMSKRRRGYESFMRLSNKLLDRIHELAYEEGVSAHGEMFPYTVAFNENYSIDSGLLDMWGKYGLQKPISNDEGNHLCETAKQEGRVTINHPFKARLPAA